MSLVLDSLKKIKTSQNTAGASVPPSMLNLAPKGQKKGPSRVLLIILAFVFVGTMIIFFMPTQKNYKIEPPATTGATAPQAKTAQPVQPQSAMIQQPAQSTAPQQVQIPAQQPAQQLPAMPPAIQPITPQRTPQTVVQKGQYPQSYSMPQMETPNQQPAQQQVQPQQRQAYRQQQTQLPDNGEAAFNAIIQQAQQAGRTQNGMPSDGQQQIYQPQAQQMYVPQVEQKSNPAYTMTGRQKQEYLEKVNYNTLTSSASDALNRGNNNRAEQLFAQALSERPNKSNLNGLLTAKIRQGKVNDVSVYLKKFSREADTGVICSAANEMAQQGMYKRALGLLGQYAGRAGSGQIYYTEGLIHEASGDTAGSEDAYARALRMSPNDSYIIYAAARNKDMLHKYGEAINLYRKIDNLQADDDLKQNARTRASVLSEYLARQTNGQ